MSDDAQTSDDPIRVMLATGSSSGVVFTSNDGRWRLVRYQDSHTAVGNMFSIEEYLGPDLLGQPRWHHVPLSNDNEDVRHSALMMFIRQFIRDRNPRLRFEVR